MKKDLGHGEIWRSQHRSRGEGSGTPKIEIVDDKRSKKVAKNEKTLENFKRTQGTVRFCARNVACEAKAEESQK